MESKQLWRACVNIDPTSASSCPKRLISSGELRTERRNTRRLFPTYAQICSKCGPFPPYRSASCAFDLGSEYGGDDGALRRRLISPP